MQNKRSTITIASLLIKNNNKKYKKTNHNQEVEERREIEVTILRQFGGKEEGQNFLSFIGQLGRTEYR